MKFITPLLGSLLIGLLGSVATTSCVVQKAPDQPAQPAAAAPPPAPATPATTATAAQPAAAADDNNAEIPADPDDPAAVADPLPPQPAFEEPPNSPGTAEATTAGIADGKPKGVEPGAPAAFWIWRNAAGVWKVRTTTAKKLHEFKGRVKGVQKPIGKMKATRTEFGDHIHRGTGGEIIFKFATKGHIDGFDFRAPKEDCIRFDLVLDTGATAKKVFIGKDSVSPKGNHFVLCTK
jgi:hypothetical protein